MKTLILCSILIIRLLIPEPSPSAGDEPTGWTSLGEGLDLGRFAAGKLGFGGDETVVVLRADPTHWILDLLCSSKEGEGNLTTQEWCEKHELTAAINAGMFDTDHLIHVGFCSAHGHVNNAVVNGYQSAAAFGPEKDEVTPFRIFDLDEPDVTVESISSDYSCVVQNLRLIKRPGEGRWSQQPKRWSEAALGEDSQGRILFIFCRTAYSMHELNEILLSLPIDLMCAQHLEGGPEAQMFIKTGEFEAQYAGSYETGFFEDDRNKFQWRVPVIFGLRARTD